MTSVKSPQKRVVKGLSPGCCSTTFSVIFMGLAILACTCKGADACHKQCTDFFSDECEATSVNSPIYWTYNGEIIANENLERFNVVLNPRGSNDKGHWIQTLTARNVCEPVNISCHEGRGELLAHHILICDREDRVTQLQLNVSTFEPPTALPQVDNSYIAAAVLVPVFFIVVAIAIIVLVLLVIWCMQQRGRLRLPVNGLGRRRPPTRDDSHNLEGGAVPGGDDNREGGDHLEGGDNIIEDVDTNTTNKIPGGNMTRLRYVPVGQVPKKDATRYDTEIELKVEEDSMSEPAVKPQVDNMDQPLNRQPDDSEVTIGQQCSDKHEMERVFCYNGEVNLTGASSPKKTNYIFPKNIPGQDISGEIV